MGRGAVRGVEGMDLTLLFYLLYLAKVTRKRGTLSLGSVASKHFHPRGVRKMVPAPSNRCCARVGNRNARVVGCSFGANRGIRIMFSIGATHRYSFGRFSDCRFSPSNRGLLVTAGAAPVCQRSCATMRCVCPLGQGSGKIAAGGVVRQLSSNKPRRIPIFSPSKAVVTFMHSGGVFLMGLLCNGDRDGIARSNGRGSVVGNVPS